LKKYNHLLPASLGYIKYNKHAAILVAISLHFLLQSDVEITTSLPQLLQPLTTCSKRLQKIQQKGSEKHSERPPKLQLIYLQCTFWQKTQF